MISQNLIDKTLQYFDKYSKEDFVVKPSLPILYFGNLEDYEKSKLKVVTVGKNPSDNEFKLKKNDNYSFCRFKNWDPDARNLIESLNPYFEDNPLKQWFSSLEPILNGMGSSFYKKNKFPNRALHTDICSPLATNPTWSKLTKENQNLLFKEGFEIWKQLIEELQPDIMLISVPFNLFKKIIHEPGKLLASFDSKKDNTKRKKEYKVFVYNYKLTTKKNTKVIFGKAANKPFGTISQEQKIKIGELCIK